MEWQLAWKVRDKLLQLLPCGTAGQPNTTAHIDPCITHMGKKQKYFFLHGFKHVICSYQDCRCETYNTVHNDLTGAACRQHSVWLRMHVFLSKLEIEQQVCSVWFTAKTACVTTCNKNNKKFLSQDSSSTDQSVLTQSSSSFCMSVHECVHPRC